MFSQALEIYICELIKNILLPLNLYKLKLLKLWKLIN